MLKEKNIFFGLAHRSFQRCPRCCILLDRRNKKLFEIRIQLIDNCIIMNSGSRTLNSKRERRANENEKTRELSSTRRRGWSGGREEEEGWRESVIEEGVGGGGWFMEIRWAGWKHTPRLVSSKGGAGVGKNTDETRADPRADLWSPISKRGTRREPPSPLLLFYRGSLLIHSHREIICILNAPRSKVSRCFQEFVRPSGSHYPSR